MDLSWNRFSLKDSKIISEILKKNHTIFGFHFDGNYGVLNERQFITFPEVYKDSNEEFGYQHGKSHLRKPINGVKCLLSQTTSSLIGLYSNCWICEGWSEQEIIWDPSKSGDFLWSKVENPLFIHFEHENWKPLMMTKFEYERKIIV